MKKFIILISISKNADLGEGADADHDKRIWSLHDKIFSFGKAWSGGQSSILLESSLNLREISEKLSALVKFGDLVVLIEQCSQSVLTVGLIADEEGFDDLYPNAMKLGVSPAGGTYPIS